MFRITKEMGTSDGEAFFITNDEFPVGLSRAGVDRDSGRL